MRMVKWVSVFLAMLISGAVMAEGMVLMVSEPWIREAPPTAKALAGYMQLSNHTNTEKVLVSAQSEAFGMVMLHRTVMEGGMAKMVHQNAVIIPAHGAVSFEPSGYHLMLMKPVSPLKAGDTVIISLQFQDGEKQEVSFRVKAAGIGHETVHTMGHEMMHSH